MNATTAASVAAARHSPWRVVVAASIGNALEWFDLVVYGFFAVTIAKLFFPAGNDTVSLLLTLGTFGVSFFMRPLGAIVIGAYSDRVGRKAALTLSILLMMIGTFLTPSCRPMRKSACWRRPASSWRACCKAFPPVANSAVRRHSWSNMRHTDEGFFPAG